MLLIGDSQVRGMGKLDSNLVTIYKSGAGVEYVEGIINGLDLGQYEQVAVWVGGNDAMPRGSRYNPVMVKEKLTGIVTKIKSKTGAKIILVSATRRAGQAGKNIQQINKIIEQVATENNVIVANAYKKLEKELKGKYLDTGGVHNSTEAKVKVLDCIRNKVQRFKMGDKLKTKSRKWEKRVDGNQKVYVSGEGCRLSMFWTEDVRIGQWEYESGEQGYQHIKAKVTGNHDLAQLIFEAENPQDAKDWGKKVNKVMGGVDNGLKVEILVMVIRARIDQSERFRQELLETGDKVIEHNVRDPFWGIVDGKGNNMYGKILMRERDSL